MAAELAESYELDPFAALLLVSRGVTADNADEFLYPQCDRSRRLTENGDLTFMRNRGATGVPTIWVHSHPMVQLSPRHQFYRLSENEVRRSVTSTSSVTGDRVLWPGRRGNVSDYFSKGKRP